MGLDLSVHRCLMEMEIEVFPPQIEEVLVDHV